ncbi:acylamino-acid-releasing enzyme isoform X1 [Silene latifolia]|uniref:acylamino-acid-releasing enzyme isoform X1 n=1 Tax=Silene latifolia TaxID=37657 RepID=UPI003D7704A7
MYLNKILKVRPQHSLFHSFLNPSSSYQFHHKFIHFSTLGKRLSIVSKMDVSTNASSKKLPVGFDPTMTEEYTSLSKRLLEFYSISSTDKAWVFKSGKETRALFSVNQPNLLANKTRKSILSSYVRKDGNNPVSFDWSPFPIELAGVSLIVPSPSGSKLLMVRNPENDSPIKFEIWGASAVEKEFHVPQSVHGSVYSDGWFEGVSWNSDETLIAYVAEEPSPPKPIFGMSGYKSESSSDKDANSWKGQGVWEEGWGETYGNKRRSTPFVINVDSGEVREVEGINRSLSAGQVVWAPATEGSHQHLVFVGWSWVSRKLGMKYCYNRPCALYAVQSPFNESKENSEMLTVTEGINSAFSPKFSPDGKFLIFLSAKACIDSGAHCATNSLHRIDWPSDGKLNLSSKIVDVVPVVMCPEDGGFPGLYCSNFLQNPWLSDGRTVILSSVWGSTQVILSVDVMSGNVSRLTPNDSTSSWNLLALDEDNIIAVCGSLVELPKIQYGLLLREPSASASWSWQDVSSPIFKCSKEVASSLSYHRFCIMKIPVRGISENSSEGASKPFEAMFVSAKTEKNGSCNPTIVVLHGGPHSVMTSGFSKSLAFLTSIGYNLLIVNYRGSLGYGEEALQSLPGKVGLQDVGDVLTAIDSIIEMKLADPSKIAVVGGSHGGFLTTHLIGQAPDKFAAAAARNPVCNLALMSGTTDIPEWCFVETYGTEGKVNFTDAPSKEQLNDLYDKSPISHANKVKTPTLFLIGNQDLRVPPSNGIQFARALMERGVETKIFRFPEDNHALDKPQTDFESYLNIGVWFNKYCK